MSAKVTAYEVDSTATMEGMITSAIREGYVVANKTKISASLILRKEPFDNVLALILTVFFIVPGLIYVAYDSFQHDRVIEIRVNRELLAEPDAESLVHLDALRDAGVIDESEFARVRRRIDEVR
jgi:hypothetical protein